MAAVSGHVKRDVFYYGNEQLPAELRSVVYPPKEES
jgi:hypothetical protein